VEIFWIIVRSPTFVIIVVVVFLYLKSKGYFNFRAKEESLLKTKGVPWEE